MDKKEILNKCYVSGLVVKLPDIKLDKKIYLEVKNDLQLIGGKWKGGKVQGFVFKEDPTEALNNIASSEYKSIKKKFQFFGTPEHGADVLVYMADIKDGHKILEPSAGQGAIIKAINIKLPNVIVDCYELMEINRNFLQKIQSVNLVGDDFLLANSNVKYDRILANPPFSKNQDIDHIMKMYELLDYNGVLVSIASTHWMQAKGKKESDFRVWLFERGATLKYLPSGYFRRSGANVKTVVITLKK